MYADTYLDWMLLGMQEIGFVQQSSGKLCHLTGWEIAQLLNWKHTAC